jgi:hypothetical protein
VLVEPGAVRLIELLNMFLVPRREEFQKRAEVDGLFTVHMFERGVETGEKSVMGGPVVVGSGEALLLEELFFALKVHLGKLDKAFELQRDIAAAGSADEHAAQIVQRVHQNSVLIVHGLNANDALVTPRQQGHISLQDKGKSSGTTATLKWR